MTPSALIVLVAAVAVTVQAGWETPLEATAKISPQERERISKQAATASQRAYAPRKAKVAQFLAAELQVKATCSKCDDKDYSDLCPLGWADLGDGRCEAPEAYTGECAKTQTFVGSSAASKIELEMTCGICWPCSKGGEACERDWARPCPNGYAPMDIAYNEFSDAKGITCAADLFYEGECEQQAVFSDVQAKKEFAERCQTSWPCQRECESYTACPNGWLSVGDGLCAAPDSYKVADCPLLQSFRGWSLGMKRDFAQRCSVDWLCAQAGDADAEGCRQLDLSSCPRHWVAKADGHCTPPPDVQAGCAATELANMSPEQKIKFASDCGVEWPCIGENEDAVAEPPAVPRATAHAGAEGAGPIDESGRVVSTAATSNL